MTDIGNIETLGLILVAISFLAIIAGSIQNHRKVERNRRLYGDTRKGLEPFSPYQGIR